MLIRFCETSEHLFHHLQHRDKEPASFLMYGGLVFGGFFPNRTAVKIYNCIHYRFASNEREIFLHFKGPTYKLKADELGLELGV